MELNTTIFNENNLQENDISDIKEFVPKQNYDHNKKMELVKKINKIKKKEYLVNIFKIILLHSKDYTENNNGVFVFFHNLEDEVYKQIESYVNKIYKIHKNTQSSNILNIYNSELSDNQNICSDTIEIENDKNLSNKEKLIMRRKKYEKYLDQNQEK
jgi:hypothetical protein